MNEAQARELLDRLGRTVADRPLPTRDLLLAGHRQRRRRRQLQAGAGVCATLLVLAGAAVAAGVASVDPDRPSIIADDSSGTPSVVASAPEPSCDVATRSAPEGTEPNRQRPPYPTNSKGLTFGSDAGVSSPAQGPDLVAVVGDCGNPGYVYSPDLYPQPSSPEEALQQQQQQTPRVLKVFLSDGATQIDTFTVAPGAGSANPGGMRTP